MDPLDSPVVPEVRQKWHTSSGLALIDQGVESFRIFSVGGCAEFVQIFDKEKPVVGPVAAHAARVLVDHLAHLGDAVADVHQFVHLLLVVAENGRDIHVIDQLGDFIGQGGLVYPGRDRAHGLGTDGHEQHLRDVVPDQSQLVTFFDAHFLESQGDVAHVIVIVVPGVVVPVAEILFAQRDFCAGFSDPPAQQLGNGKF